MRPRARGLSEADRALWADYATRLEPLPGRGAAKQPVAPAATKRLASPVTPPPAPPLAPPQSRPPVAVAAPRKIVAPLTVGDQPGGIDKATWQRFRTGK